MSASYYKLEYFCSNVTASAKSFMILFCFMFHMFHIRNHSMHNFDADKFFCSFATEEFTHYLWKVLEQGKVTLVTDIIYCV